MGEWKETYLGEYADVLNGFAFKSEDFSTKGVPVIKIKNVASGKIKMDDVQFYPHELTDKLNKFLILKGSILIAMTGSHATQPSSMVGRVSRYDLEYSSLLNQRVGKIYSKDLKKLNETFLYYFLVQNDVTLDLAINAGGSANQANIAPEQIKSIPISLPAIEEQKSIASILSSMDEKIDLLHRQNKTLEALAETLFRQWFVEEAEEGWEKITLSDIADHVKLSINPAKKTETIFEHYSIPAFDEGQEPKRELGSEIRSNKYRVLSNTILVSKLNPRTPRVWSVYGEVNEDSSICSTEFQIVKPRQSGYFGFIYCYLKSWNVMQELANAVGGTSGSHQRVNPEDIFKLTLRRPPLDKFKKFDRITNDYWEKIRRNRKQIRTLTRLRDTLLPKLMSGEIRVKV
jgi:type I restriction enzyme S subunit